MLSYTYKQGPLFHPELQEWPPFEPCGTTQPFQVCLHATLQLKPSPGTTLRSLSMLASVLIRWAHRAWLWMSCTHMVGFGIKFEN
jgi:hypothetical protein